MPARGESQLNTSGCLPTVSALPVFSAGIDVARPELAIRPLSLVTHAARTAAEGTGATHVPASGGLGRSPNRGSTRARIRRILSLCRTVITMARSVTAPTLGRFLPARNIDMGIVQAPASEATDTMRVAAHVAAKTRTDGIVAAGASTRQLPSAVATPFPPEKRRKTEKIWPRGAARTAAGTEIALVPNARASATATAPLPTSAMSVTSPAVFPAARVTFVAPMFPLPTARTSIPTSQPTTTPVGTDPIR